MSAPPLEAPILNSTADPTAGRKMAKISSSTGSDVRGRLMGYSFSKALNNTDIKTLAYTVFMPNCRPTIAKPAKSRAILAANVKSPADIRVTALTTVEKPVTPPNAK